MLQAGKLDRQITIERATQGTQNAIGTPAQTWTTVYTPRAQVISISGAEIVKSGAERAVRLARFVVRWLNLDMKDRVVYDGLTWNIIHLREIGRREGVEILAQVTK